MPFSRPPAADALPAESIASPATTAPEPADPATPENGTTTTPPAGSTTAVRGPFTVGDEGVTWVCAACGSANPIDLPICSVCGSSFKATVEPETVLPERDPNMTTLVALVYPGAGFAYLGRWPEAIGRGVVATFTIAIALIAALVGHGSSATFIAIAYGLAAFGLWAASAHDAYRVAQHQEALVILKPRTLLYVLLGLLVLFLVILMGTVIGRASR